MRRLKNDKLQILNTFTLNNEKIEKLPTTDVFLTGRVLAGDIS